MGDCVVNNPAVPKGRGSDLQAFWKSVDLFNDRVRKNCQDLAGNALLRRRLPDGMQYLNGQYGTAIPKSTWMIAVIVHDPRRSQARRMAHDVVGGYGIDNAFGELRVEDSEFQLVESTDAGR